MFETLLVVLIAFVIFMLFWGIVHRAKQSKRRSPLHSCGACGQGCDCSGTNREPGKPSGPASVDSENVSTHTGSDA